MSHSSNRRLKRLEKAEMGARRIVVTKQPTGVSDAEKAAFVAVDAERKGVTDRDLHVVLRTFD